MYNAIWKKVYFPDDACIWYFPAKRKVRQLLEKEQFDVVITVSLPFTAHLIGLRLRNLGGFVNGIPPIWLAASRLRNFKNFVNVASNDRHKFFWLADIGDPFSIQAKSLNNSFLYGKWSRRLEQIVLESADAVTVTTEFTLQEFRERFGQKATAKMFVVPPLLHPPPPIPNPQSPIPNPQSPIRIGYFGALYAPVRTPDALLDLLEKTFALKPDMKGRLEAHFYGEIFPEFYERLTAQPAVRLHGLRSRSEVQRAMSEMDILVNIGNTTDFQLPSKVVDYLASGKPVVNLSYTDTDPFASFFGDNNLILNLKVENGRVGEKEVRRWLTWLEEEKKMPDKADLERLIAPYLVESVAASYLRWMKTGQPFSPNFPE
ncbi:MAG: hypothetical protein EPGJADBJ_01965 [Saprospiraceae bacterium]|nr:hypothetical protein [Saprospiraceae bacterium]